MEGIMQGSKCICVGRQCLSTTRNVGSQRVPVLIRMHLDVSALSCKLSKPSMGVGVVMGIETCKLPNLTTKLSKGENEV
jgi:hypothetical protein